MVFLFPGPEEVVAILHVVEHGSASRAGPGSEYQDSWGAWPPAGSGSDGGEWLFVVADGLGGHQGGREASQLAVHGVEECFREGEGIDLLDRLERAYAAANRRIVERAEAAPELRGMATTCSALVLRAPSADPPPGAAPAPGRPLADAFVAHVGDSRVYHVRDGVARQLTSDHTVVGEMVRRGELAPADAATHPRRHVLRQALGTDEPLRVELLGPLPLGPGDAFLLCSDGLADLGADEIAAVLSTRSPQDACDALISLAVERGADDDVTVVVVTVEGGGGKYDPGPSSATEAFGAGSSQSSEAGGTRPDQGRAPSNTALAARTGRSPGRSRPRLPLLTVLLLLWVVLSSLFLWFR